MTFTFNGKAPAFVRIAPCLLLLCLASPPLHAEQQGGQAKRIIALGKHNSAHLNPLIVVAGQDNTKTEPAPATVAATTGVERPRPADAIEEETPAEGTFGSGAGADPQAATPEQPPVTTRLFGSEDAESLFGARGGYFHPSLLVGTEWTDNLYNIKQARQSNTLTMISPGIWIGFPRMEEPPISFSTSNAAIGGSRFLVTDAKSYQRFLAYLAGNLDYKMYSADSTLNTEAWRVEGYSSYKMPAGITMHLLDRITWDRDRFDRGSFSLQSITPVEDDPAIFRITPQAWDYTSNMINGMLQYEMSDRYSVKLDYTNFLLTYDDDANSWLNRTDNNVALSLAYHYSPKTSFFAEYAFADVTYEDPESIDSTNTFYYGGISWKGSAKMALSAKGGYQARAYEEDGPTNGGTFSMESLFDYMVTDKTKVSLTIYKAIEETNTLQDGGMETLAARLRYEQRFTYRLRGTCEAAYELNDHAGFARTDLNLPGEDRKDSTFSIRPAIEYSFRDWLAAGLSYTYEVRDSSDPRYDYYTQTISLGLIFSL